MPSRWALRPSQQILAASIAGVVLLIASFTLDQWRDYEGEIAQAERNVRTAATLLAEHTARTFDAVESVLQAVARVHDDAESNHYDPATIHRLLEVIHGGSPVLQSIDWVDVDGSQQASLLSVDPPPLNVADQEQFLAIRDGDGGRDRFYVAAPARSRLLGSWVLSVGLRLETPEGGFNGVVGGVIDQEYFAGVFRGIELGQHDIVTLFRRDGKILLREPVDESLLGTSLAERPFMTDFVRRAPVGTFHARGLSDEADRVIGYAEVPSNDFIVTVAARHDEVLSSFWHGLAVDSTRMALVVLAFCLGTWLLVRQMLRREQLAAELRSSEARFRDFAASSGDWFWETDAEHRFVWMSDSIEAVIGVAPAWHLGRSWVGMIAPVGTPGEALAAHIADLQAQRSFRDFEYVRRGPTGDHRLRVSGVPVFDDDGRFQGYRGSGRDITELWRAEQRLRDAVESLPVGFMLFDADDRLVYINGNTADVMPELADQYRIGDTFEQILRRCVAVGAAPDAMADPEAWIARRLDRHAAAQGSTVVRFAGRVVEVVERPTSEGGIMALRFDITDREQAREAAQVAREAADSANQAKSEFLSSMSHELRTPLNSIIGFGQILMLDRDHSLSADQQQYCDNIVKSGEHLLTLVNEVLDLAGVEAGRLRLSLEPVLVSDVLHEAVKTMRPVAVNAGIDLRPIAEVSVPDVHADTQRLRQVLLNLLSNAIKYNRPNGSVTVAAQVMDGSVRIAVTDTGLGIAPEHHDGLFVPFQRLGAEFTHVEGTGIGLALSKQLIEAMGGRIGVSSEPGYGSTFWVEVPISTAPRKPASVDGANAASPLAAAGGYSVLYIEDNPLNVSLMEYLLETLPNVTMHAAPSGQIGLDLARVQKPEVIVLDLNLPEMDGFEVLARLNRDPETAGIPVIALTASAMTSEVKRGLAAGFFRYLTKPLKFDEFLACVDAALSRPGSLRGQPHDRTASIDR